MTDIALAVREVCVAVFWFFMALIVCLGFATFLASTMTGVIAWG